jgi:hypothetical protein
MIVAWNSLMISGLAKAAAVFQKPDYLELATQAAQFIQDHQFADGRFHRLNYDGQASVIAQSEDYALFIKALLDLDQSSLILYPSSYTLHPSSTFHSPWLEQAVKLQDEFDEFLWSVELGGYYNTDASRNLMVRERSYDDNATPSANGVAIANLVRLTLLTADLSYLDRAEQALQGFSGIMNRAPQACPTLFVALDWFRNHTLIRTNLDSMATLETQYLPTVIYKIEAELPEGAIGLVCQGLSCQEPARNQQQLQEQIRQSLTRA